MALQGLLTGLIHPVITVIATACRGGPPWQLRHQNTKNETARYAKKTLAKQLSDFDFKG